MTLVALLPDEYVEALEASVRQGIVGGSIYDALLAKCALKVRAQKLFTWNIRHYEQFGPEIARLVEIPQ